ncbi:hypothetical protein EPN44_14185 [bacterium]|nr:MAG: hypothetical protein EPN44_14185 [bacterium]
MRRETRLIVKTPRGVTLSVAADGIEPHSADRLFGIGIAGATVAGRLNVATDSGSASISLNVEDVTIVPDGHSLNDYEGLLVRWPSDSEILETLDVPTDIADASREDLEKLERSLLPAFRRFDSAASSCGLPLARNAAAALHLRDLLEAASDTLYWTRWKRGIEHAVYDVVFGGQQLFGNEGALLRLDEIERLRMLYELAGGWWAWSPQLGHPVFTPADQWQRDHTSLDDDEKQSLG